MEKIKEIFTKEYIEKNRQQLITVFNNIKQTIKNNSELKRILSDFINNKKLTKDDKVLLSKLIKDNFKLVGISTMTIVSFPIPMSTLLLVALIKLSKKMGIDMLPSEFQKIEESLDYDNLIDISKYTKADWDKLQKKVMDECFPDVDFLNILPVKVNRRTKESAMFHTLVTRTGSTYKKDNNGYTLLTNPHYQFTKLKKWDITGLRNVMAHEMIHYYCSMIYGVKGAGHGYEFKREMRRINNETDYTVSLKDDEFVLSDSVSDEGHDIYLFVISKDKETNDDNYTLASSSKRDLLTNFHDILKNNGYNYIYVYSLTKKSKMKYGVTNSRKPSLYKYRNRETLNDIINNETTKLIEVIDL